MRTYGGITVALAVMGLGAGGCFLPGAGQTTPATLTPTPPRPAYTSSELQKATLSAIPGVPVQLSFGPKAMTQGQIRDLTHGPDNSVEVSPARCQATYDGMQGANSVYQAVPDAPASLAVFRGANSEVTVGLIVLPPSYPVEPLTPSLAAGCEKMTFTGPSSQRLTMVVKILRGAELPKPPEAGVRAIGMLMSVIEPDGGRFSIRMLALSRNGLVASVAASGPASASSNDIVLMQWRTARSRLAQASPSPSNCKSNFGYKHAYTWSLCTGGKGTHRAVAKCATDIPNKRPAQITVYGDWELVGTYSYAHCKVDDYPTAVAHSYQTLPEGG